MVILFYISLGVICYTYFGYPLLLMVWKLVASKPVAKQDILPTVSVLISVHNEDRYIEERIKDILKADYPRDRLEILIGCDGCTDETVAIVDRLADTYTIRFRTLPERIGKPAMLNVLAREAGERSSSFRMRGSASIPVRSGSSFDASATSRSGARAESWSSRTGKRAAAAGSDSTGAMKFGCGVWKAPRPRCSGRRARSTPSAGSSSANCPPTYSSTTSTPP